MFSTGTMIIHIRAIQNVDTGAMDLGKVKFQISQNPLKVGNFDTKTEKPKFSKISQKSNFGRIIRSHK